MQTTAPRPSRGDLLLLTRAVTGRSARARSYLHCHNEPSPAPPHSERCALAPAVAVGRSALRAQAADSRSRLTLLPFHVEPSGRLPTCLGSFT